MGELSNTTINGVSYDFKDAGAARQPHSHTKSQITDFPTSMPASDVSAWAKASTKPTYTASEVGAVPNTAAGVSAAINQLTTGDSAPTDNDYYVSQYAGGGTSTTTYHRRPVSKLWDYIKSKLSLSTTGSGNAVTGVSYSNGAFTVTKGSSFAASSHTHNYAGSSSAGGAATSANKLNTNAGSATQPVYFSNGVPVAITHPFFTIPINHNMVYRGQNLGATLTDAQHTALSSGNFTDLYLGDYWTKTVTIPSCTVKGGDGEKVTVPAQTNITLKAVIADFDTFYAGYDSAYAGINTHHAAVIVTGFSNVVWNKTDSTAGGYFNSLIHKWLVVSALPQIETWFGSDKVLSHQKFLTNQITGEAASLSVWRSQKISLLSENQMYGSKVWGNSKATNGEYEPGEAFKHLNVFNHIDANLLFGSNNIWLRDIASAELAACLYGGGVAYLNDASNTWVAPAALILLS